MPFKFLIWIIIGCLFLLDGCNPVYENIDDMQWNSLHNVKPFQSNYFHSADYRLPEGACDEAQCHGSSLTGGNSGAPSCLSCHDNQWSVFQISHIRNISGYYHRSNVDDYPSDRTTNIDWFSECKTCHGASLAGVTGYNYRYSCKVCHGEFSPNTVPPPGHSMRKSEEGKTGWHHYNYQNSEPGGTNTYCSGAACHGSDGSSAGTSVSAITGLAGHGPACSDCHD